MSDDYLTYPDPRCGSWINAATLCASNDICDRLVDISVEMCAQQCYLHTRCLSFDYKKALGSDPSYCWLGDTDTTTREVGRRLNCDTILYKILTLNICQDRLRTSTANAKKRRFCRTTRPAVRRAWRRAAPAPVTATAIPARWTRMGAPALTVAAAASTRRPRAWTSGGTTPWGVRIQSTATPAGCETTHIISCAIPFYTQSDHFTKTSLGQT
jgi:hypothetical protein